MDSFKLAKEISDEAAKAGKVQQIFLQVNNAEEEQKFGFSKSELFEIFTSIKELPAIEVAGLMNMAPLGASEEELNKLFSQVRDIKNELEQKYNCELREISMGMSQDYNIAVKNGATMLRIGRKLFK